MNAIYSAPADDMTLGQARAMVSQLRAMLRRIYDKAECFEKMTVAEVEEALRFRPGLAASLIVAALSAKEMLEVKP